MRNRLVIIGAGSQARVAADIVRLGELYSIEGFIDDLDASRRDVPFCGSIVIGGSEALSLVFAAGVRYAFAAIGDCAARLRLAEAAHDAGFDLPILRHPGAIVASDASVGSGSLLAAGAIVNPAAHLGAYVIVNTAASVDHECTIADGVHIGPGARLGGGVAIGRGTWIGIGAVVKDGVRVGGGSIVGAGAVVVRDIPEAVVAYGSPARVKRRVSDEALPR